MSVGFWKRLLTAKVSFQAGEYNGTLETLEISARDEAGAVVECKVVATVAGGLLFTLDLKPMASFDTEFTLRVVGHEQRKVWCKNLCQKMCVCEQCFFF